MKDRDKIGMAEAIIDVITDYDPDEIFSFDRLKEWALDNGFVEEDE